MITKNDIAPYMKGGDKVILFDGVCKLCSAWSRFVITYDKDRLFKLASVQSEAGQAILKHFGLPTNYFKTMLYIEDNIAHEKSDALLKIMAQFPHPIKTLSYFTILPKPLRNWAYDRIALNRYQLFGKYDQCLLPTSDHERRFL